MGCIHRTNINNIAVIENTIRTFAQIHGLVVRSSVRSEFPDWELRDPDDESQVLIIDPNIVTSDIALFITPHSYSEPAQIDHVGELSCTSSPEYIRDQLPRLLRSACIELGWITSATLPQPPGLAASAG